MSRIRVIFQSSLVETAQALTLQPSVQPASTRIITRRKSYGAFDAYTKREMHRLNIPGVSLAIVEGDQIVQRCALARHRGRGALGRLREAPANEARALES